MEVLMVSDFKSPIQLFIQHISWFNSSDRINKVPYNKRPQRGFFQVKAEKVTFTKEKTIMKREPKSYCYTKSVFPTHVLPRIQICWFIRLRLCNHIFFLKTYFGITNKGPEIHTFHLLSPEQQKLISIIEQYCLYLEHCIFSWRERAPMPSSIMEKFRAVFFYRL